MKRETHIVNHTVNNESPIYISIYYQNTKGEQFKVKTTTEYLDLILDQINAINGVEFIKKSQFDKSNKITINLTHPDIEGLIIGKITTDKIQ